MLNIFICEDNKIQRENLKNIIENIILIENYDMKLSLSTGNPYEILNYLKENNNCGIYFLDVDLQTDINGIQLAEKIRQFDPRGFIVFITTHAELSYLTFLYKVEAMDYIIKDNFSNLNERIADCIKNAHNKYSVQKSHTQKVFSTKIGDKIITIPFNEIIFFETSSAVHKVILHSENRQLEFYSKLKYLEPLLDDRFYRYHNSFIVNKEKIKEIDKKNRIAYMINDEECLISTRAIKNLL